MSVQFDEYNNLFQEDTPKGISGFLISKGIASDKRKANVILASVIIFCLIVIILVSVSSGDELEMPFDGGSNYEYAI